MGDNFIIVCDFYEHNVIKHVFCLKTKAVPDRETIAAISDSPNVRLFQDACLSSVTAENRAVCFGLYSSTLLGYYIKVLCNTLYFYTR